MMENFVLMELARQLAWSQERGRLYHYRTKDRVEVDAVIETPDSRIVGIEVKAGATVRTADLAPASFAGSCRSWSPSTSTRRASTWPGLTTTALVWTTWLVTS